MAEVCTVADLWQEWKVGLGGAPPVEELEQCWGACWRPQAAQRTAFCCCKVILDKINCLVDLGQTIDLAVAQLEALRAGKSIRKLSDTLQAQRSASRYN
jgi:hypothetical protein